MKRPRGRPKNELKPIEEVKVDVKEVAKEVVSKKLKSILDEIIKEHTPVKVKKTAKKINPKLPMKITKFNQDNGDVETINTSNYKEQIENDIVVSPVAQKHKKAVVLKNLKKNK